MYGLERKKIVGEDNVYDFSIGNPRSTTPQVATDTLKKLLDEDPVSLHAYSVAAGHDEVREQIADYISKTYDYPASPENIFVTTGAAEAIASVMCAIAVEGEEVIVIAPYFPEYSVWIKNALATPVEVMADPETFQIDVNAVKAAITDKTAAVIINSPCNPTGAIYSEQNIKDLSAVLNDADHKIYLVCDEPYRKINYGKAVPWVPKYYEHTIVCDSASKTLSMPGERIGHVFCNDKKAFDAISGSARALGHVCAPVLFQRMYGKCIDVQPDVSVYDTNRKLLTKMFDELGITYVDPQGAFYLWAKSPCEDFVQKCMDRDILVVPSDSFGIQGWFRIGYCVSTEMILNSMLAWKRVMANVNN